MEKKFYAKLFMICLWVLLVASVGLLCYVAFIGKFSEGSVDALLYWAYGMLGLAIAAIVCVGLYITATTHPKNLIKIVIVLAGAAALCGLAACERRARSGVHRPRPAYAGNSQTH